MSTAGIVKEKPAKDDHCWQKVSQLGSGIRTDSGGIQVRYEIWDSSGTRLLSHIAHLSSQSSI